jgi:AcrR family transcriptional regulator
MAQDRKGQILAAAYEIVGEDGLEGLHARSVAAKVGINHAAVHYYFATRNDLLVALAEYTLVRFSADRDKLIANTTDPATRIEAHLAQAEAYCKTKSRFVKNWTSLFVAAIADEKIRKILADQLLDWTKTVKSDVESGGQQVKKSSPFVNPELLVGSLLGLLLLCHTMGPKFDPTDQLDLIAGSLLA